jgi:hypothetical protein
LPQLLLSLVVSTQALLQSAWSTAQVDTHTPAEHPWPA